MPQEPWPNLAAMFFNQVDRYGDRPFLWAKRSGHYRPLSWGDTAARVTTLVRGLLMLGIEPGDRVMLVSENRPAWLISDVAIMAAGAISVPAYTTNTEDDHLHILSNSDAKGIIVSTRRLAERLMPAASRASNLKFMIAIETPNATQSSGFDLYQMDDIQEMGRNNSENVVKMANQWQADETACIIYTSGTGGTPKGVMLSHKAILHNCAGAEDALGEIGLGEETFLSFLPLSHSYEHTAGQFFPISIGAEIYYAESVESLSNNMLEAKPTIMTAVPRLYEMLHQRIAAGVKKTGGSKEKLFNKALFLGQKHLAGESLGIGEKIQDKVLDKLVRNKVRARFGGRLKALVSGGAPLNPDIAIFFSALGLRLLQGYGQTETAPVVSVNRPSLVKLHTVGPPLLNTEVKIVEDGEILVRGDLLMQGYWGNEEATRATIIDGWVHTGDIGEFDEDGYLIITDRKKDIIVNSGGDNLAPQRIEGIICMEPEISQAMVYGDKHPHIVALLVPDDEWLKAWAVEAGKSPLLADAAQDEDLLGALRPAIHQINEKLSNIEKVRRFIIADESFTIDNAQMTPTMKVRRHKLKEVYGERLELLYS